jgi:hypothetical protein
MMSKTICLNEVQIENPRFRGLAKRSATNTVASLFFVSIVLGIREAPSAVKRVRNLITYSLS